VPSNVCAGYAPRHCIDGDELPPANGCGPANVRRGNLGVNKYGIPYFAVTGPVRYVTARRCAATAPGVCNCGTPYNHLTSAVRHLFPAAAGRTHATFHSGGCSPFGRPAGDRPVDGIDEQLESGGRLHRPVLSSLTSSSAGTSGARRAAGSCGQDFAGAIPAGNRC
jgi:hypothetical protein